MTSPTPVLHTADWLNEVSQPGPTGFVFPNEPENLLEVQHVGAANFIMEDDTDTSKFTPGCGAYAGYNQSSPFANMTKVKAYAATQHAQVFCYSGDASDLAGADAFDIEPGLGTVAQAPGAFTNGIRYFYGSASWTSAIVNKLTSAGIARSRYKIISAHYIGSHICAPSSCGYPAADATQFADNYLGRSLDATLCPASFFGTPPPEFPMGLNATGPDVAVLQKNLNRWAAVIHLTPALVPDGQFGGLTQSAVKLAQAYLHTPTTGLVSQGLFTKLSGPLPVNPTSWVLPRVADFKLLGDGAHSVKVSFTNGEGHGLPGAVTSYQWAASKGSKLTGPDITGYPRSLTAKSGLVTWQEGGFQPSTQYTIGLRELSGGGHASAWTTATFKTPAA